MTIQLDVNTQLNLIRYHFDKALKYEGERNMAAASYHYELARLHFAELDECMIANRPLPEDWLRDLMTETRYEPVAVA